MKPLLSYLDYRRYLKDRYRWLKKNRRGVSFRSLSQRASFSSPNFFKLVMEGDRNLSAKNVPQVCQAFEIPKREVGYFSALVRFNQAKNLAAQDAAYQELRRLRGGLSLRLLEHGQMEYFERWHHVAIREMASFKDFRDDPRWIQKRLVDKVSLPDIRKSLDLLKGLGLLAKNERGRWVSAEQPLSSGDETAAVALYRFHRQMIPKGLESLQKTPPQHRDVSSLTLALSPKNFQAIKERIQGFRKELLAVIQGESNPEAVYQLNIQFFNLTECL